MTDMRIIPRAEWGARYPNGSGSRALPATEVWLHHSVTIAPDLLPPFDDDYEAIRTLEKIGQDRFGAGISYTWLITPAGLIFEGHSVDRVGTHTQNHNTVACAICFVGNYDVQAPTTGQLDAAAWLLRHAHASGWITAAQITGGHCDLKATGCPGGLAYAAIPTINEAALRGPTQAKERDMSSGTLPPRTDPDCPGRVAIAMPKNGEGQVAGARLHLAAGWYNEIKYRVWCVAEGGGYVNEDGRIPYEYTVGSDMPGWFFVPANTAQISIEYTTANDRSDGGWFLEIDYR